MANLSPINYKPKLFQNHSPQDKNGLHEWAINHPLRLSLNLIHKLHKLDGLQPFLVLKIMNLKKVPLPFPRTPKPSNKVTHLASRRLIDLQLLHEMLETHEDILPSGRLWPSISPRELSEETSLTWNSPPFSGGESENYDTPEN